MRPRHAHQLHMSRPGVAPRRFSSRAAQGCEPDYFSRTGLGDLRNAAARPRHGYEQQTQGAGGEQQQDRWLGNVARNIAADLAATELNGVEVDVGLPVENE